MRSSEHGLSSGVTGPAACNAGAVLLSVLNYNLVDETINSLRALLDQEYPRCHVELVDNGSTNDCTTGIRAALPDITMVQHSANMGYAAGMNAILERGFAAGYRFVLLCNNDITLATDAVARLIETADTHSDAGVVGGVECAGRTGEVRIYGGLPCDFARGRFPVIKQARYPEVVAEPVAWSQGCVVLWTRRLYDAGVRYDERLFMYYEEADLAMQMKRVGLRPYVDKRVRVLHFNEERSPNLRVAYYMQRNRVYLLRKHGSRAQFAAFCVGRLAWELAWDIGKIILRYQPLFASTHLRASWDGLLGRMCCHRGAERDGLTPDRQKD